MGSARDLPIGCGMFRKCTASVESVFVRIRAR